MKRIGKLDTSVSVIPSPTSSFAPFAPFAPFAKTLCATAFLCGVFVSSLMAQDELPPLEPIPSPVADAPTEELPSVQNGPTLADPSEALEPIPADGHSDYTPIDIEDEDTPASRGEVEQASYESPIVEGPFLEGPALEPIADAAPQQPMVTGDSNSQSSQSFEYQPQPIQLPHETSTPSVINNASYSDSVPSQSFVEQPSYEQIQYEQPQAIQPTYVQSSIPQPTTPQPTNPQPAQPDCGCNKQRQPQVQTPRQVVVQSTQVQPAQRHYIRVNPVPQNQQAVVAPGQSTTRYYVSPQQPQARVQQSVRVQQQPVRVQQVQFQQVPANSQRQVRPAGFQQVQVTETTETTRYRPVQVRVTETYRPQPRPTTIVVPVAPEYVPFQPFRNAARRRW